MADLIDNLTALANPGLAELDERQSRENRGVARLMVDGTNHMTGELRSEMPIEGVNTRFFRHKPADGDDLAFFQFPSGTLGIYNQTTGRNLLGLARDSKATLYDTVTNIASLGGGNKQFLNHAPSDGDNIGFFQTLAKSLLFWNNTTQRNLLSLDREANATLYNTLTNAAALGGANKQFLNHAPPDGDNIGLYQTTDKSLLFWNNTTSVTLMSVSRVGNAGFSGSVSGGAFSGTDFTANNGATLKDNRTRADAAQASANNAQARADSAYNYADTAWNLANSKTPQHQHVYSYTTWRVVESGGVNYMADGGYANANTGGAFW